jgi:hypothetical protein
MRFHFKESGEIVADYFQNHTKCIRATCKIINADIWSVYLPLCAVKC